MSETFKLFVYGTLKEGFPAFHGREILCKPQEATLYGYKLLDLGAFPGMVPGDTDDKVCGEIHEYPLTILPSLDAYEGVPTLFYREELMIEGEPVYIYLFNNKNRGREYRVIESGVWEHR